MKQTIVLTAIDVSLVHVVMSADKQLIEAAKSGEVNLARRALAAGANPNCQEQNVLKWTPLHFASV